MCTYTFKIDGVEHTLPGKFEVCPECEGSGTELYGSLKGAVFTPEDFANDPEFAEDYFGGSYDVACSKCKGLRVVPTADLTRCTFAEKRLLVQLRQAERARYESRLEAEAERKYLYGY